MRRKQAPRSRQAGKAGERRVEDALSTQNCIVQWVDTSNDIGRDAYVELVAGTDVLGSVVCIQVKSGSSYQHNGQWSVPGHDSDFSLWRESTVPIFGITHDPTDDSLRWVELTALQHNEDEAVIVPAKFGRPAILTPDNHRLDRDSARFFTAAVRASSRMRGLPIRGLLSESPERVEYALLDLFALGRLESTPLELMASLISRIPDDNVPLAVSLLSHATSHPDIGWTSDNWVQDSVKRALHQKVRWHSEDVVRILQVVDEENAFGRGSIGQSAYHILRIDPRIDARLFEVCINSARGARTTGRQQVRAWAASILCYHAGEDARETLRHLMSIAPDLREISTIQYLSEHLIAYGWLDLF